MTTITIGDGRSVPVRQGVTIQRIPSTALPPVQETYCSTSLGIDGAAGDVGGRERTMTGRGRW